jgi:hypothetical protein
VNLLRSIFNRTLNSVFFGIGVMLVTGLYIAIGSGVPAVREAFEMNELQFFNAWPLKMLMMLLVLNLTVVTWVRIPLTWPRLGVWMIHSGIVTLIMGMAFYYTFKVEGLTYIGPQQTVTGYYDGQQRSLYIQYVNEVGQVQRRLSVPLVSLPRFKTYTDESAFSDKLKNRPLAYEIGSDGETPTLRAMSADLGLKQDITVDVVGYHPYANLITDYEPDPAGKATGIRIQLSDPHSGQAKALTLVGADPTHRFYDLGGVTVEHTPMPAGLDLDKIAGSSTAMHKLDVTIGDIKQSLTVQVGKTYEIGTTGYSLTVENFNPSFPMSGTGEPVKILTLMVKNTGKAIEFRRMVIDGKPEIQTDFKLNEPGGGPMGKRQKEPLDKNLVIAYTNNDPLNLVPSDGSERHIFFTSEGKPGILHLAASGDGGITAEQLPADGSFKIGGVVLKATRQDNLLRSDRVVDVPPAQRQRVVGESGDMQVLSLRVKCGDWSQIVHVPFLQWAKEQVGDWRQAPVIDIPNVRGTIQLSMGNTWRPLPAKLTLQNFKLVNYPGGTSNDNLFRDFVSTLRVEDINSGEKSVGVAKMNQPIYFDGGRWLFFQAQYDKQNMATIIGIGNRPGVGIMTGGCILMAVGLLYAFYLKPVIIRKRKERALREAGVKTNGSKNREAVAAQL